MHIVRGRMILIKDVAYSRRM